MSTTVLLFRVPIWPTDHHLPLVRNHVKVTKEAHVWVKEVCPLVKLVYIDHNPCLEFTNMRLLQCPPLFCCCLFQFDPEAIICHWWLMESVWLKKYMYECHLIFKWSSWSIFIIIHILNSQICACCSAHHCFAVACSNLTQRPSFATSD
jgi:hypothetical protein